MAWARKCQESWRQLIALAAAAALAGMAHAQTYRGLSDAATESLRQEFLSAYSAARSGNGLTDEADSRRLRDYVLYPYLVAARLAAQLAATTETSSAADRSAREFLDQHAREPVSFLLHRQWLASLAGREAWQSFIANYDRSVATVELECQHFNALIATDDTQGLGAEITARWLTPSQLPIECESAFQWLRDKGVLDDELTEQRVKLLLKNGQTGFARVIARRLPSERAEPLLQWARLLQDPISGFDALLTAPQTGVLADALRSAWPRFASANPPAALERFDLLLATQQIGARDASRYARDLALGLAWDRLAPDAIATFLEVDRDDLDDYALEWLTRSALWAGDWRLVKTTISEMSPPLRETAPWRYWEGRAAERLEDDESAETLFDSVIDSDNYYSALAAAHLGRAIMPHVAALERDEPMIAALGAAPAFQRARELFALGLRTEATREWQYGSATLSSIEKVQSVHLAADWGWYDIGVATATRHNVFNDYELLYPRPYDAEIGAAANLAALPGALLYGLLRQESLYREDAVSEAGAVGLTQLLPETARRTATSWQVPIPSRLELYDAGVNIKLGAAQLKSLADEFDDQLVVALAAYNAGPNAARRWLPERPIDGDIWVENIPYNETRAFVRRVLWHSLVFAWLDSHHEQSARDWIATVSPLAKE